MVIAQKINAGIANTVYTQIARKKKNAARLNATIQQIFSILSPHNGQAVKNIDPSVSRKLTDRQL